MGVQEYHDKIKAREEDLDKSERELLELMAITPARNDIWDLHNYSLTTAPSSKTIDMNHGKPPIGLFSTRATKRRVSLTGSPPIAYFSTKSPHRASQIMPMSKKMRYH